MASVQVSLPEFLGSSAEGSGETGESDDGSSQTVYISKHGTHYHDVRAGSVPACPHIDGEKTTLRVAAKNDNKPCPICDPPEWKAETEGDQ
jgi:hypothetical protein